MKLDQEINYLVLDCQRKSCVGTKCKKLWCHGNVFQTKWCHRVRKNHRNHMELITQIDVTECIQNHP